MRGCILFVMILMFSGCLGGPPGTEEAHDEAPDTPVAESTPDVWQSAPLVVGHMEFSMDGGPWVQESVFHWSHNVTAEDVTDLQRLPGAVEHQLELRFVTDDPRNLTGFWSISAHIHGGPAKAYEKGEVTAFQVTVPTSMWVGLHIFEDERSVSWFGQRVDLGMEWVVEGTLAADLVLAPSGARSHRFLVPTGPGMVASIETSAASSAELPFGRTIGLAAREPFGGFQCRGGQAADPTQDDTSHYLEIESWSQSLREVWVGLLPQECAGGGAGNMEPVPYRMHIRTGPIQW